MCAYAVDVQVDPDLMERVPEERLARLACEVLEREGQPENAEMTLVITDDARIRELNRAYRGIDEATDVLSFPAGGSPFVTPDELPPYLGDVIISYPTARAQAGERGASVDEELALLVVHGCLHLVGYDHATPEEQERMGARQEDILRRWH